MNGLRVRELSHVRVQVPDLDEAERFFHRFGLRTTERTSDGLYLRGTGPEHHLIVAQQGEPRLLATGFELSDASDLERASDLPRARALPDPDCRRFR